MITLPGTPSDGRLLLLLLVTSAPKELSPSPSLACDLRIKTWPLILLSPLNLFCGESSGAYDPFRAKSDSSVRNFRAYVKCRQAIYRNTPMSQRPAWPGCMHSTHAQSGQCICSVPALGETGPFWLANDSHSSVVTRILLLDSTPTGKPVRFLPPGPQSLGKFIINV